MSAIDLLQPATVRAHFDRQADPPRAVPTPLPSLNHECRDDGGGVGFAFGWHVTIGGASGAGKSLLGINLVAHAIKCGIRCAYISLEMSPSQLATRLYATIAGANVYSLERGSGFDAHAASEASAFLGDLYRSGLGRAWTNTKPATDVDALLRAMLDFHNECDCEYFVVDYMQLVHAPSADSLLAQITRVSRAVREFAQAHEVITIGLSQLNRETAANRYDSPTIFGLFGGSPLENDSDLVLLLDHSRYERDPASRTAKTWLLLDKNRHGAQLELPIEWDYKALRVREALPDEEEEWPGAKR
jgi:replicative DNA helicase